MMNVTIGRAWLLASCLLLIDIFVMLTFLHKPLDMAANDQSHWDFRISELRQFESQLTHKQDVSISEVSPAGMASAPDRAEAILAYFHITKPVINNSQWSALLQLADSATASPDRSL